MKKYGLPFFICGLWLLMIVTTLLFYTTLTYRQNTGKYSGSFQQNTEAINLMNLVYTQ